MTKKEALSRFKAEVLPGIRKQYEKDGVVDTPARCEAWNDWTDALMKNKEITPAQYESWDNPF
jgi:GTP cyclohydrolase I